MSLGSGAMWSQTAYVSIHWLHSHYCIKQAYIVSTVHATVVLPTVCEGWYLTHLF